MTGGVRVTASDGMVVDTERATYNENDSIVRAVGHVKFSRGRMSGSGIGMSYDRNRDQLTVLDEVVVNMAADRAGAGLAITAPAATLSRQENLLQFPRGMTAVRGRETIAADVATAHLSADEDRLETLELRGNSRITGSGGAAGGLEALTGRDINLRYAAGGQAIEHALIVGDAVMQLTGDAGGSGGKISANTLEVTLADEGRTPVALAARDDVLLAFPPQPGAPARTVRSQSLDGVGTAGRGLTRATFLGSIQFYERGGDIDRSARAQRLDVALAPGLAGIDEATFTTGVRFGERDLMATAANARYAVAKGILELRGSEPGSDPPRVVNDRLAVNATRIDVTLTGPILAAAGAVESQLKPAKKDAAKPSQTKMPSMLKADQPVIVTAGELHYDGPASRATYTGDVQLVQGDTALKASSMVLDERTGDLAAAGPITSTIALEQPAQEGAKRRERVRNTATSKEFKYEEKLRRATYTGDAHVVGPQGDMTATRIELYLQPSGDELEFVEAHEAVTLRDKTRKTTGSHMKYFSADERYEVTGSPVTTVDECGREFTGKTLTLFRTTDRIVLDGGQMRTQTRGNSTCS
jgi:lipopolysaccharide transport protein LptA